MLARLLDRFYTQNFDQLPDERAVSRADLLAHLRADPQHAVVLTGEELDVAVWQDESGAVFYHQELPLEEPDGTQFDSLEEALDDAIEYAGAI